LKKNAAGAQSVSDKSIISECNTNEPIHTIAKEFGNDLCRAFDRNHVLVRRRCGRLRFLNSQSCHLEILNIEILNNSNFSFATIHFLMFILQALFSPKTSAATPKKKKTNTEPQL
jgi:hypothetical protein